VHLTYAFQKKAELEIAVTSSARKTERLFIITGKIPFCPLINGQINKKCNFLKNNLFNLYLV